MQCYFPMGYGVVLLAVFASLQVFAGGDISGGGSLIYYPGKKPFLLDFAMLEPSFKEQRGYEPSKADSLFPMTPEEIIYGKKVHPGQLSPEALKLLQARLSVWERTSPHVVREIRKGLENENWRVSVLSLKPFLSRRVLPTPKGMDKPQIKTVSAAVAKYGILINDFVWNHELRGLTSRAGLLAHEALRLSQLEQRFKLRNEGLQRIVAIIMLRDPSEVSGIDGMLSVGLRDSLGIFEDGDSVILGGNFFDNFSVDNPGLSSLERRHANEVWSEASAIASCLKKSLDHKPNACTSQAKHFPNGLPNF